MGRRLPPLLAILLAAIAAWALPADRALLAKGKKPEIDPIELDFDAKYASPDAAQRAKAVAGLANAPDPLKLSILSRKVIPTEKRADVLSHVNDVLRRITDESVIAQVVSLARNPVLAPAERVPYVEAVAAWPGNDGAHAALLDLVKDKETYVRGMAAYGLGEHRSMDALEPLLRLLDDKQWQVQSAALAALPRLPDKAELQKTVPTLVDFLANVTGRMRTDAAECLRRITGRDLGREPDAWRKYLAGEDPSKDPSKEGEEEKPKGVYAHEEKPHFYGIDVVSNRVLLILDISLSMYDPIEIDKDRLRRETSRRRAVTGPDDKDKDAGKAAEEDLGYDIPWWKIKTRLDLAKYQTINLVSQLREEQKFDIITFSTDVTPWMGKLVPATSDNKQKAIAMLETIKPEDKTNTWGALAAAFDMMDVQKKGAAEGPDEAYLVTDGQPSIGDIVEFEQIREAVVQLHKMKPLRINVIVIGANLRYLKKLATETGGQAKFFE